MLNIAVCISGGGTDLQSVIDACERGEINGAIKLVISNRKNAYGLTRARNHGIKAEVIRDEDAILERFAQEKSHYQYSSIAYSKFLWSGHVWHACS